MISPGKISGTPGGQTDFISAHISPRAASIGTSLRGLYIASHIGIPSAALICGNFTSGLGGRVNTNFIAISAR